MQPHKMHHVNLQLCGTASTVVSNAGLVFNCTDCVCSVKAFSCFWAMQFDSNLGTNTWEPGFWKESCQQKRTCKPFPTRQCDTVFPRGSKNSMKMCLCSRSFIAKHNILILMNWWPSVRVWLSWPTLAVHSAVFLQIPTIGNWSIWDVPISFVTCHQEEVRQGCTNPSSVLGTDQCFMKSLQLQLQVQTLFCRASKTRTSTSCYADGFQLKQRCGMIKVVGMAIPGFRFIGHSPKCAPQGQFWSKRQRSDDQPRTTEYMSS